MNGGKNTILMLSTDIIFSHVLTIVPLSGWTSFYPQELMTSFHLIYIFIYKDGHRDVMKKVM